MRENYNRMLAWIALLRIVDSRTVSMMFDGLNDKSGNRAAFISRALRNKHIRRSAIKERKKDVRRTISYFTITNEGLNYLASHYHAFFEFRYVHDVIPVFKKSEYRLEIKKRLISVSTSVIVAVKSGAAISTGSFAGVNTVEDMDAEQKEYTVRDYYREYLDDSITADIFASFGQAQEKQQMVFHSSQELKFNAAQMSAGGSAIDYSYGRYAGVLDSRLKCMLIYSTTTALISWNDWLMKPEIRAYSFWCRTKALANPEQRDRNGSTAVLLVDNPRDFANHLKSVLKDESHRTRFGGSFGHCYIVPKNEIGAAFLRWIMLLDERSMNEQMKNDLISSAMYEQSDRGSELFPLTSAAGNPTCLGFMMDGKIIERIYRVAEDNPEIVLEICCYDWQIDYYARVLPENVLFNTVPMIV